MADGHILDLGRKILASQPFSVFLDAELLGLSPGTAELRIPIRPEFALRNRSGHDRQAVDSQLKRVLADAAEATRRTRRRPI